MFYSQRRALIITRAREDTVLPLSEPIQGIDGTMMKEIPVPKDTVVLVGVRACNCNKAIWGEDALQWKPERWLAPLPTTVTNAKLPGVYSNLRVAFYHLGVNPQR